MIQLHSNTIARRLLFFPVFFLFSISSLFAGEEKTDIDYTQYLTSDSAFAAYLRAQNIAITNNNKLELLSSGRKKFASLFSEIKKAKHHVHLNLKKSFQPIPQQHSPQKYVLSEYPSHLYLSVHVFWYVCFHFNPLRDILLRYKLPSAADKLDLPRFRKIIKTFDIYLFSP